ncbi:MAG: response regulator transcription factor [Sulfitobacter sp.]|nr:response regulator transcription factor [Sulfitobacter sp.]
MTPLPRVHIIEDDAEISSLLSTYLKKRDFECVVSDTAESGQRQGLDGFDLFIVDITLPGQDGLSFCRWVRGQSDVPLIILSAMRGDANRIKGIELGADDYLEKPFNPRELLARINGLLRRSRESTERRLSGTVGFAGWMLDMANQKLQSPDNTHVPLSSTEYQLITLLLGASPDPVSREVIGRRIFEMELGPEDRRVDILVSRLRKKLSGAVHGADFIRTVRNKGYQFAAELKKLR